VQPDRPSARAHALIGVASFLMTQASVLLLLFGTRAIHPSAEALLGHLAASGLLALPGASALTFFLLPERWRWRTVERAVLWTAAAVVGAAILLLVGCF